MNDLIFNELSVPSPNITYTQVSEQIEQLLQVCKQAKAQFGLKKLRFTQQLSELKLLENYTFQDYIADTRTSSGHKNLLLGLFSYPFINDEDETEINAYIAHKYYYHNRQCDGLATAYIYRTISVSLLTDTCWNANAITICIIDEKNNTSKYDDVLHCSKTDHLQQDNITAWYRQNILFQTISRDTLQQLYPSYQFTTEAIADLQHWQQTDQQMYRKVHVLLHDIVQNSFGGGLGKTEVLSHSAKTCSKRITRYHRLSYWLSNEDEVQQIIVYRCKEHYT